MALGTGTLEIISAPAMWPQLGWGLVAMATGLPVMSSSITAQFTRAVELPLDRTHLVLTNLVRQPRW